MQEIERIKVYVSDLKPGMYVAELDRPWLGTPFLFQGFPITSDEQIAQLRECCQHVFVDVTQSVGWEPDMRLLRRMDDYLLLEQPADDEPQATQPPRFTTQRVNRENNANPGVKQDTAAFLTTLQRARETYGRTHEYVSQVLDDVRLGRAGGPGRGQEGGQCPGRFHHDQ